MRRATSIRLVIVGMLSGPPRPIHSSITKDHTFVDLAKQVTSEDTALPYDQIPEDHEAEVFLWKKCCLDAYAKARVISNADGSPAKGNPKRATYPWATMRDTMCSMVPIKSYIL
jgi:hypothetical protein